MRDPEVSWADAEQTWDPLLTRLRARLDALVPGEFLTLSEDVPTGRARGGLWSRLRSARPVPTRYVQFLACNSALLAEVVGPAYWPSTLAQQNQLLLAGWAGPETVDGYPSSNFVRSWDSTVSTETALAAIEALEILGATPAREWTWTGTDG